MSELLVTILNKLGLGKGCRVFNISNMKRYMYDVFIGGDTHIFNDTLIKPTRGTIVIKGAAKIIGDAVIESKHDWIVFKNWWSSGRFFTWTRSNDMWAVGCFYGTGKELIARAYKDSKVSGREYERIVKYVERIKRGSKPSLWHRVLLYLKQLYK